MVGSGFFFTHWRDCGGLWGRKAQVVILVHALETLRIANHNSVQEDCGGSVVLCEKVGLLEQSHKRKRGVCGNLQFFTPLAGTLPPCNFSPEKKGATRGILADWQGWRAA